MKRVLWLKRDLRLNDNEALNSVAQSKNPYAIFIFNPDQLSWRDTDIRHWVFIFQSLNDLRNQGLVVNTFFGEPIEVFNLIHQEIGHFELFSHQESGTQDSWDVDKLVTTWAKQKGISWKEFQTNAVVRGAKNRNGWDAMWIKKMKSPIIDKPKIYHFGLIKNNTHKMPQDIMLQILHSNIHMVPGGESKALGLLNLFLEEKVDQYWANLSMPEKSRYYCSFLSAHISYGNISLKQIYQACEKARAQKKNKKSINQYMARLKWHCHFIQNFEMDPSIQSKNMNSSFDSIRKKSDRKLFKAWRDGQTGYPLIDAAMRCVKETGYLNFRLRSTVVSFLTHILWQPWKPGADHLAKMFLDYEPGIHYPQFQMQAATTGIHTVRIYNPIKQSIEKDKNASFIKSWVPELAELPNEMIHCPWKLTKLEESMFDFKYGKDYPKRIVDFDKRQRYAREKLWAIKSSPQSKSNSFHILKKHARKTRG
jgi:deoxyribodipyrimidine photo-lyase